MNNYMRCDRILSMMDAVGTERERPIIIDPAIAKAVVELYAAVSVENGRLAASIYDCRQQGRVDFGISHEQMLRGLWSFELNPRVIARFFLDKTSIAHQIMLISLSLRTLGMISTQWVHL